MVNDCRYKDKNNLLICQWVNELITNWLIGSSAHQLIVSLTNQHFSFVIWKKRCIFATEKNNNMQVDFTFQEYLGFLAFLGIATMGFWLMIFLLSYVVPYWVFGAAIERFKESRAAKKQQKQEQAA